MYYNINSSKHYSNWVSQEKIRLTGSPNQTSKLSKSQHETQSMNNSKSQTYENFMAITSAGKEMFPSLKGSMLSSQISKFHTKGKSTQLSNASQSTSELKFTNASLLTKTRMMKFSNMIDSKIKQSD